MYQTEKDRDEVVVTCDDFFDVVNDEDGGRLVLTIKRARKLAEALLDATMVIHLDAPEEDG